MTTFSYKFFLRSVFLLIFVFGSFLYSEDNKGNYFELSFLGTSKVKIYPNDKAYFEDGLIDDGSLIDKANFNLVANISNVEVQLQFKYDKDKDNNNLESLRFDKGLFKVNRLFNEVLDISFYDIGYGAGKNYSIRPDLPVRGVQFDIHPIKPLTLSLGYGITQEKLYFYPMSNGTVSSDYSTDMDYSPSYHAFKFDVYYDNYYVPFHFFSGILLADNRVYADKPFLTSPIKDVVIHSSLGLSFDFLAAVRREAMKFDLGITLPVGPMSKAIHIQNDGSVSTKNDVNFLFQLYGATSIAKGFGFEYYVHFALDTYTKQETLGDLDDDYFKEAFRLSLTPSYTYGPITFAQNMAFNMIGDKTARSDTQEAGNTVALNQGGAYNSVSAKSSVIWRPIPFDFNGNFMVEGYYEFDSGNLDLGKDNLHELGLKVGITFSSKVFD